MVESSERWSSEVVGSSRRLVVGGGSGRWLSAVVGGGRWWSVVYPSAC